MNCTQNTTGHRKTFRRFHTPGDHHELTFSCYKRLPILTNDQWRFELARQIDNSCSLYAVDLVGFVFMPEHVHLLVFPLTEKPKLDDFLARIKQPVSSFVHRNLEQSGSRLLHKLTVQERPGKKCFRFWQEGPGYDRNLNRPSTLKASLDYIHRNPVSRGFCSRAVDWKWSSACFYLLEPPRQQFAGLPRIHRLNLDAFDEGCSR